MIVRVWKARAKADNAQAYRDHLETHVFPVLQSIEGFLGVQLLERADGTNCEFVVESRWADMKAVRAFAGDAFENAVVAPAAKKVLSWYDTRVEHYEVTVERK